MALGAGALTPLGSFAQQRSKVWRIGFLTAYGSRESSGGKLDAFVEGLRKLGYVEGKNITIEWRYAGNDYKRLPGLAAELVHEKVDIIVTSASSASRAAQKATGTIPIVALGIGDPIGYGLAASLARPGGNVTGFSNFSRHHSKALGIAASHRAADQTRWRPGQSRHHVLPGQSEKYSGCGAKSRRDYSAFRGPHAGGY